MTDPARLLKHAGTVMDVDMKRGKINSNNELCVEKGGLDQP